MIALFVGFEKKVETCGSSSDSAGGGSGGGASMAAATAATTTATTTSESSQPSSLDKVLFDCSMAVPKSLCRYLKIFKLFGDFQKNNTTGSMAGKGGKKLDAKVLNPSLTSNQTFLSSLN